MARVPVKCQNIQLLAWKSDDYYPFACATDGRLSVPGDMLETTTPSSGSWKTYMPAGTSAWSIEVNMVTVLRDLVDTFWFSWETILESVRKNPIQIKWKMVDASGYERYATGSAWITDTVIGFNMNEAFSESRLTLLGSGALNLSSLITPNNPRMLTPRPEWITTGAENGILTDTRLIGKSAGQIQQVSVQGDDKWRVIDSGIPVEGKEVKLDNTTGSLIFTITGGQFDPDVYVYANVLV